MLFCSCYKWDYKQRTVISSSYVLSPIGTEGKGWPVCERSEETSWGCGSDDWAYGRADQKPYQGPAWRDEGNWGKYSITPQHNYH